MQKYSVSDSYSGIPYWILEKVRKPSPILVMSIENPVRMHQFSKSPQLKHTRLQSLNYEQSKKSKANLNGIYDRRFRKQSLLQFIKENSGIISPDGVLNPLKLSNKQLIMSKHFKNRELLLRHDKRKIISLPPVKKTITRSIAINSLIPTIGLKLESRDDKETEWENSHSEDDEKNLKEYLLQYNLS